MTAARKPQGGKTAHRRQQSAGQTVKENSPMPSVKRLPTGTAQPTRLRDLLTVAEVCGELQIAQSTFYEWRTKGTGPRCIKLPNGQLRVRRGDLNTWLDTREDAA